MYQYIAKRKMVKILKRLKSCMIYLRYVCGNWMTLIHDSQPYSDTSIVTNIYRTRERFLLVQQYDRKFSRMNPLHGQQDYKFLGKIAMHTMIGCSISILPFGSKSTLTMVKVTTKKKKESFTNTQNESQLFPNLKKKYTLVRYSYLQKDHKQQIKIIQWIGTVTKEECSQWSGGGGVVGQRGQEGRRQEVNRGNRRRRSREGKELQCKLLLAFWVSDVSSNSDTKNIKV